MADINRGSSNQVDSGNSSTSTLTANSVFTGSWMDVLEFAHICVQVIASHVSATDGLQLQWSSDGTNIDDDDVFTVPANNGKSFTFGPQARYFRIIYTNGPTNQTTFRLHTTLKIHNQKPSSHRISTPLSTDDDAELTKAIISGERVDLAGQFGNAKVTSDGRLLISQELTAPANTTVVVQVAQSSIAGDADTLYTITSGKTLTIQRLQAGSQTGTNGSKVSIFEDPNGNLSVLNLISVIYVDGASTPFDLSSSYVGNGTRRILMRRSALGGGSREVFGRWEGFEV